MSVLEILGAVLIGPLKILFEIIFSVACDMTNHPGLSIVVLSLAMNVILLPLYRRADAIQEAARDKENEMKPVVSHIKATFSGDERMMILQACYRENNYNPLSVLSGSLSLMLEIPFFLAAYQFLSSVEAFRGLGFGPIADLGKPDGLLAIGNLRVNVLPILMTLINVVSSALYLKGFPLKTKIQLYGMALFFLVFLYNRPSALVLYWTLNNTFSLLKTLYYKLPHSKKILAVVLGVAGCGLLVLGITWDRRMEQLIMIGIGLLLQAPWALPLLRKTAFFTKIAAKEKPEAKPNTLMFLAGGLFLSILIGLLIPSTYISDSVQEYIIPQYFYSPIWYVVQTLCLSVGFFLVWMSVFYWLAKPRAKVLFTRLVWVACGVMVVNYMFFGTKMGVIKADLVYEDVFRFTTAQTLLNLLVVVLVAAALFFLSVKFRKGLTPILLVGTAAILCMGIINVNKISKETTATKAQLDSQENRMPSFTLSQDGENVVVIMLDRAIGPFVPYIMEENPELKEQFDGFTFYENTLSYGGFTNFATPSLFGGYEYTPKNSNLRDDMTLEEKQNEALKVMPAIFAEEGYQVSVVDPPYAGYAWIPDLSVFDDMEGVEAYAADGRFNDYQSLVETVEARKRNFFFFSLMKTMPVALQPTVYDNGAYHALPQVTTDEVYGTDAFVSAYNVLNNMDAMTQVSKGDENTLLVMRSNLTHEPMILQEPDYLPVADVDNSDYYTDVKIVSDGENQLVLSTEKQLSHYHTNVLALKQLGEWFDYLRENDLYDNTRIIVVADHGRNLGLFDEDYGMRGDGTTMQCIEFYQPMLLVKDFKATGFTVDDRFMTNADVPLLAAEDLIDNPVNPYTGNALTDEMKNDPVQYVIISQLWDIGENYGNRYMDSQWAAVSGDVSDRSNWTFYLEETPLPPED